jgi:hypothetical protein
MASKRLAFARRHGMEVANETTSSRMGGVGQIVRSTLRETSKSLVSPVGGLPTGGRPKDFSKTAGRKEAALEKRAGNSERNSPPFNFV